MVDERCAGAPTIGEVNHFRFGEDGFNDMKVVELYPGKRVKWKQAPCFRLIQHWKRLGLASFALSTGRISGNVAIVGAASMGNAIVQFAAQQVVNIINSCFPGSPVFLLR